LIPYYLFRFALLGIQDIHALKWYDTPHYWGDKLKKHWDVSGFDTFGQSGKTITELFKENTINKIIRIVLESRDGVEHGVIAKKIGMDRKNLRPYMKKLMEQKLIVRRGKNGKYFIGERALGTDYLALYLFADSFIEKVFGLRDIIINDSINHSNYSDFRTLLPHFKDSDELGFELERTILEFSNKIGAFITYVIIQSLDLRNKQRGNFNLENELHDFYLSHRWIRYNIDLILPRLPFFFKESIRDYMFYDMPREDFGNAWVDYSYELPLLQLNKKQIDRIATAYGNLYPIFYSKMEKIRKELPEEIQEYIDHLEYIRLRIAEEKRCNHYYKKNLPRLIEENGKKIWTTWYDVKHCTRCHHTIYPKMTV
jgi:hypothetical protein